MTPFWIACYCTLALAYSVQLWITSRVRRQRDAARQGQADALLAAGAVRVRFNELRAKGNPIVRKLSELVTAGLSVTIEKAYDGKVVVFVNRFDDGKYRRLALDADPALRKLGIDPVADAINLMLSEATPP